MFNKLVKTDNEKVLEEYLDKAVSDYTIGSPSITDEEFDILKKRFERISGTVFSTIPKDAIDGVTPYSMKDEFSTDDVIKTLPKGEYIIEPKYDGVYGVIQYFLGKIVSVKTKTDVVNNYTEVLGIPKTISELKRVNIKGEFVIRKDELPEGYKNCRNTVAGSINTKKIGKIKDKNIRFVPWEILPENYVDKRSDTWNVLKNFGFEDMLFNDLIVFDSDDVVDVERLDDYFTGKMVDRSGYEYDIDGLAIKLNDIVDSEEIGYTSTYPKFSIALKFPAEFKTTVVRDVVFGIGAGGSWTPKALVEPVEINGVTISNVTLHNITILRKLNISKGSEVVIARQGDVIPKVVKVISSTGLPDIPVNCTCGSVLIEEDSRLKCLSKTCPEKKIKQLSEFVGINGIDIKYLSEATITKLVENNMVEDYPDIFKLSEDDLEKVVGSKMAEKIYKNIGRSIGMKKHILYGALTIHTGGKRTFKTIFDANIPVDSFESLQTINGIGKEKAFNVSEYVIENRSMLSELESLTKPVVEAAATGTYNITGSFSISRKNIEKKLSELGYSKTKGKADFILIGSDGSPIAIAKAQKNKTKHRKLQEFIDG
jgi:DNA ligase (NAD+)